MQNCLTDNQGCLLTAAKLCPWGSFGRFGSSYHTHTHTHTKVYLQPYTQRNSLTGSQTPLSWQVVHFWQGIIPQTMTSSYIGETQEQTISDCRGKMSKNRLYWHCGRQRCSDKMELLSIITMYPHQTETEGQYSALTCHSYCLFRKNNTNFIYNMESSFFYMPASIIFFLRKSRAIRWKSLIYFVVKVQGSLIN